MKQSEWINVKDRLPDETGFYKVKIELGSMTKIITEREKVYFKSINGHKRFMAGDWTAVTHWQPLPDAPERD